MLLVRQELQNSVTHGDHALSIGVFDGVHRGHQMLIGRMVGEASLRGLTAGIVTFHPHPLSVVRPDVKVTYLESLERRVEMLRDLGRTSFQSCNLLRNYNKYLHSISHVCLSKKQVVKF